MHFPFLLLPVCPFRATQIFILIIHIVPCSCVRPRGSVSERLHEQVPLSLEPPARDAGVHGEREPVRHAREDLLCDLGVE